MSTPTQTQTLSHWIGGQPVGVASRRWPDPSHRGVNLGFPVAS